MVTSTFESRPTCSEGGRGGGREGEAKKKQKIKQEGGRKYENMTIFARPSEKNENAPGRKRYIGRLFSHREREFRGVLLPVRTFLI